MHTETFVTPMFENGNIIDLGFNVIVTYEDGTKKSVGSYSVTNKDIVDGYVIVPTKDPLVYNLFKKALLDSGLAEIVGDSIKPENYFWKEFITIPPEVTLTGAFDRACKLAQERKYEFISEEELSQLMRTENEANYFDDEPQVYDGIYGSDEFDRDAYNFSDYEDMAPSRKGR